MHLLKQGTQATVLVGPVLAADGTAYTGAAIADFNLTKNGTTAALAAPATCTHDHNGHYLIALAVANTDTLGRLTISCNKAPYAMGMFRYEVLAAATFDALVTNAANTANGLALVGSQMDLKDAPNPIAITAIQNGLSKPATAQTITPPETMATLANQTAMATTLADLPGAIVSGVWARAMAIVRRPS